MQAQTWHRQYWPMVSMILAQCSSFVFVHRVICRPMASNHSTNHVLVASVSQYCNGCAEILGPDIFKMATYEHTHAHARTHTSNVLLHQDSTTGHVQRSACSQHAASTRLVVQRASKRASCRIEKPKTKNQWVGADLVKVLCGHGCGEF